MSTTSSIRQNEAVNGTRTLHDSENRELTGGRTIYFRKEELRLKKMFYVRLAILLTLINLILIVNSFGQLVTVNNVNVTNTSQITIKGDLLHTTGASVTNHGTIDLTGDFTNNASSNLFGTSGGTIELNGGDQDIAGSFPTTFHHLKLSGTGAKTLQLDAAVGGNNGLNNGVLSLTDRQLDLNRNTLTVTNAANTAITRTSGYIVSETDAVSGYGMLNWVVKNNAGLYIFPFGNLATNSYLPVAFNITNPGSGTGGVIGVATYPTATSAAPNNRPLPTGLSSLIDNFGNENASNVADRWWVMDVSNYTTQPVSDITFTYRDSEWDGSAGSTNTIAENMLKAQSNDGAVWTPVPFGSVNTVANTVTVTGMNTYNPLWTLVGSSNPLPVELLTFTAKLNSDRKVDLEWATATEINNDFFTLEKSRDGVSFEPFEYVDGAGNSTNVLYYASIDREPYDGITYYRLKQTDFDGVFTYSEIRAVRLETAATSLISVFPNPATDHFYVKFENESPARFLFIIDVNGKVVREIAVAETEVVGTGLVRVERLSLEAGMYFVSTADGKMEKLVLQ